MQAVGSSTISLATLQQMFGTLQNDLSSLTGQFGAEAIGSSAIYLGRDRLERPRVWPFPSLAAAAPFILERVAV